VEVADVNIRGNVLCERPPGPFHVERSSLQDVLEGLIKLGGAKLKSAFGRFEYTFLEEMEDTFGQLC
jgi:hypothetical protein